MKKNALIFLLVIFYEPLAAQVPFVCKGDYFMAIAPGNSSTVYTTSIDPNTSQVVFNPLPAGGLGFVLNSIGYRSVDNFIYGINDFSEDLYKIDAGGKAFFLKNLTGIDHNIFYPAGDISPDGKYLVLVGGSQGAANNTTVYMVLVDLESPDFTTTVINVPPNNTVIYDIAFDPTNGRLYGYDSYNNRLVTIDFATGAIGTPFPSGQIAKTVGSLFFDAFGNLYCYGSPTGSSSQTTLFRINKTNGLAEILAEGPVASRTDGCSCPYNVELTKTVKPEVVVPCTEAIYTFQFANSSGVTQSNLTFRDDFPGGFIITAIQNPLAGDIVSGIGSSTLLIENMSVPLGIHQLAVTVVIPESAAGVYNNQATIVGLPSILGDQVVSDNPKTVIQDDATPIEVVPLEVDFSQVNTSICSGDELLLAPSIPGVRYLWSDGSTAPTFTITDGGTYAVTVTSGCDVLIETITVQSIQPQIFLDSLLQINLGESIELKPAGSGVIPLTWSWSGIEGEISCKNCSNPLVSPLFDASYSVTLTDGSGCSVAASTKVEVLKNRNVYVPNAFSPNGDDINDYFFAQSPQAAVVRSFKIFSRWGDLVFEIYQAPFNEPSGGWDGFFKGKQSPAGVYVWILEAEFLDGETASFKGDVTLVR